MEVIMEMLICSSVKIKLLMDREVRIEMMVRSGHEIFDV